MNKFFSAIESHIKRKVEQEELRQNQIDELNPTIDDSGRYHAPCSGFEWIDGNTYAGGEYLPVDDINPEVTTTVAVKVSDTAKERLTEMLGSLVGFGKSWTQNGVNVQKAYITCSKSLGATLRKYVPDSGKKLVLLSEAEKDGLEHGQAWKFNTRGLTNAWNESLRYNSSSDSFDRYCEQKGLVHGTHFEFNKDPLTGELKDPKSPKSVFSSALKGQMVCYAYTVDYLS